MSIKDLDNEAKRLHLELENGQIDRERYYSEISRLLSRALQIFFYVVLGIADVQQRKDLFQEVMLKFLETKKRPDLSEGLSLPWFQKVARHAWIDEIRKTRPSAPLDDDHCTTSEGPLSVENRRLLAVVAEKAFADLSDEIRFVAWSYFMEERTQKDIAEIVGMPETTVNYYVGLARKKLCAKLKDFVSRPLQRSETSAGQE